MSKFPCYKCTERQRGCHGVCERYKVYSDAEKEKKKLIQAKKDEEKTYANYICETFARNRWGEVKRRKMKEK